MNCDLVLDLLLKLRVHRDPVQFSACFYALFSIEARVEQFLIVEEKKPFVFEKRQNFIFRFAVVVTNASFKLYLDRSSLFGVKIAIDVQLILVDADEFFTEDPHVCFSI